MLVDKISEEYPKINLHKDLFNINQLLYKAYNGKFPNTKATIIDFNITPLRNADPIITKEIVLKSMSQNLDSHNVIKMLFSHQLNADEAFIEANDIIWDLQEKSTSYRLTTSDYFMSRDEFINDEFEANIKMFEED